MRQTLRLTGAPAVEPVSTADAQEHLRAPVGGADGGLIAIYMQAAREAVEAYTGHAMITQTWQQFLPAFPDGAIVIARRPLIAVSEVAVLNAAGTYDAVGAAGYQVSIPSGPMAQAATIRVAAGGTWPTTIDGSEAAVRVTFTAGYGASGASVPAALRAALLLMLGDLYENREASAVRVPGEIPAVRRLLDPYVAWTA